MWVTPPPLAWCTPAACLPAPLPKPRQLQSPASLSTLAGRCRPYLSFFFFFIYTYAYIHAHMHISKLSCSCAAAQNHARTRKAPGLRAILIPSPSPKAPWAWTPPLKARQRPSSPSIPRAGRTRSPRLAQGLPPCISCVWVRRVVTWLCLTWHVTSGDNELEICANNCFDCSPGMSGGFFSAERLAPKVILLGNYYYFFRSEKYQSCQLEVGSWYPAPLQPLGMAPAAPPCSREAFSQIPSPSL